MKYRERLDDATSVKQFLSIANRHHKIKIKEMVHLVNPQDGRSINETAFWIRNEFILNHNIMFRFQMLIELVKHYQKCSPRKRPTVVVD
ncbi:hypothetical protein [Acinetobacter sp. A47]|uniref:hypothetical protein n=1 Tax=Acinetobacter sp. A47 TaxID=1561217 RepID=UPI0005717F7A|nr:hypothetical protein [Acinetobacter sp. A47]